MVMKMKKIMEYLQHYINQYPHRLALVFEDRHLTYGELSKEIYQASMRYKEVKLNALGKPVVPDVKPICITLRGITSSL